MFIQIWWAGMDSNHRCILRHGFTVRYLRQLGAPAHNIDRVASTPHPFIVALQVCQTMPDARHFAFSSSLSHVSFQLIAI